MNKAYAAAIPNFHIKELYEVLMIDNVKEQE